MRIQNVRLIQLRNEEHFQFHKGVVELIEVITPGALQLESRMPAYLAEFANESEALNVIRKNSASDELRLLDRGRDRKHRGLNTYINAMLYDDDEQIVTAARRLLDLFKFYGNIARKPYDEETGALHSLIGDLRNKYAAEVSMINATSRVDALENLNVSFEAMMKERYTSEAGKSELRMKDVRTAIDEVYNELVDFINASIIVNGEAAYAGFVKELNERIERVNLVLAQRAGYRNGDEPENPAA